MDYFSQPGLSFHELKDFATISPGYYHRAHVQGTIARKDTGSMRLGRLFHMAILEHDKFELVPIVPAEHLTPSGELSAKSATREWLAMVGQRDYMTPNEMQQCQRSAVVCWENYHAGAIIEGSLVEQETYVDAGHIKVKGKADIVNDDSGVWDLKSIKSLDNIAAHCRDMYYPEQVYWHNRLFNTGKKGGLIVVEKDEPRRVAVIEFGDDVIAQAKVLVNRWLDRFIACTETSIWPNDPPYVITLSLSDMEKATSKW